MFADFHVGSIRPRAASVVAVIWLYLGVSWSLMGLFMAVFGAAFAGMYLAAGGVGLFLILWYFSILALGVAGLWGAFSLLKLRASGRALLEAVNWAAACLTGAFSLYWVHGVLGGGFVSDVTLGMAALGLLTGLLTTVPFLWMGKALRGREVRMACEQFLRDRAPH